MGTYILKDPLYNSSVSKIQNFSEQWLKYYPIAKKAYYNLELKDDDIVIANLYKGNPFDKYTINEKIKKIFIVHSITNDTVEHLEHADYVIYINDLQRQIVEDIIGIEKPHSVAPRHPMHEFKTEVSQEKWVYFGGWFTDEKVSGLFERVMKLHKELPEEHPFGFYPIWGNVTNMRNNVIEFDKKLRENNHMFGDRQVFISKTELFYDIMVFKTRLCEYAYLWGSGPTIEEVKDLISAKDINVLNYSISESSMLSTFQSSPCNILVEDRIKFLPYFEKTEPYTYKQFSSLVKEAIIAVTK